MEIKNGSPFYLPDSLDVKIKCIKATDPNLVDKSIYFKI